MKRWICALARDMGEAIHRAETATVGENPQEQS